MWKTAILHHIMKSYCSKRWLENVIQKALVHKTVDGRDTVSVTMGGSVYEMTSHTMD